MAVKGKGKQIATKSQPPSPSPSTSSGKRKKVISDGGRRRKRRIGALHFFDDVAKDADYDDDEEEEEEKEDDDIDYDDEGLDLDFSKGGRSEGKDYKGSGKSRYLPFLVKEEALSGDELEELIRDRYGRGSEYVVYDEDPKECNDGLSVEHSAEDPNIWRVKCLVGREQQIVLSLMHKFADLLRRETKMEIVSAFTLEHLKGYVYIEADKAFDVVEACKGFFNIYPSRMGLVPRIEIPQLLSVRNKACGISKGTWVRMKSGKYKGDLGQVIDYDDTRRRATIKLVPRVDLQAIAKKYGGGVSLKEAAVPAPRLISSHELEQFRPHIEIKHDRQSGDVFEILDGLMLKDGYLYKKVSITSISYWGVQPSKDELLKFSETSKAEEEDVSWLSSVFNVRKKMKSSQTPGLEGTSLQRNSFNLHDLVLFGRKGFGVIIDMGKDGIKILKGDAQGHEVITVKTQDIKSSCVDKMFTASDRHRKTISINDVVKVLDGPVEGRQGIVKHLYKGTLFIYDENQEENSGIFCSKSDVCENIASQKDSSFRKAGNKSSSSFNQSSEHEDSSRTFSMNRRSETNQTFSIGQSLRIRKGPLKGYLCRVVRIHRSDVTVKLDSLVKVITVHEQFLSIPNVRRDSSSEMPSDVFGAQERSIGGLPENGEQTMATGSWDIGSSSWQALSVPNFSFSVNKDQKTDQQGADPWGSKLAPSAKDQEQGADPWGSKVPPASNDSGQGADPWGSKVPAVVGDQGDADPWGSKLAPGSGEHAQGSDPWGSNVAGASADKERNTDPWASKSAFGDSSQSNKPLDNWAKASSASGVQDSSWNKAAGEGGEKDVGPWNKSTSATSRDTDQGADPWGSKVSLAAGDLKQGADLCSKEPLTTEGQKGADPWRSKLAAKARAEHEHSADPWGGNVAGTSGDQGRGDPWGKKLAVGAREEEGGADPWGSTLAQGSRGKEQKADPWSSNAALADPSHSNKPCDGWAKASSTGGDPSSSWNKAAVGSWEKEGDAWNKTSMKSSPSTGGKVASGWETASAGTKSAAEHGGEPGSWDKVKVSSGIQSGWDGAGWGKADSLSKNATDEWSKPNSFGANQVFNEDTDKFNQRDSWDKPSNFEGGCGRGRGRDGSSWDKPMDHDDGQGSGWRGGSDGIDGGRENGWNRPRDFDGGRGSNRGRGTGRLGGRGTRDNDNQGGYGGGGWGSRGGRGRGRYGGRGNGDEDNQDDQGGFGGGWGSGRGRGGRGRYGGRGAGGEDNQDNQGGFGGGWGSGRGREGWGRNEDSGNFTANIGRGQGGSHGRFQSSDRNNDQDNFGDKSSSVDPASSWGNQQGSWNKSKEETGHIEHLSGWDGWSSKQSSHGKKDEGDNKWDASKKAFGDSQPPKWNQGSAGIDVGGGDKWNTTSNNEGNNWSMPQASNSARDFSGWERGSAGKEATGVGCDWGRAKQSEGNELSSWADDKAGTKGNSWDSEKPQNAQRSSGWNDARKEWTKSNSCGESGKPSSDEQSTKASNWDSSKSWVSQQPSEWNKKSTPGESCKELGADSGGNWSKPKPFTSGNQSSAWGNVNSGDWSKPKSSPWNDSSSGFKDGDGDQPGGGWNCGSSGGRGDSFSGRGRGFRGRGRNFSGGRSSDGSGGRGDGRDEQSENFSGPKTSGGWGQSSNRNEVGSASGSKSNCNANENAAGKGPWDIWNAKKVSDGSDSKLGGLNSSSFMAKEGAFGIGSSSQGEQQGGWGSGSNREKVASSWDKGAGFANSNDDGWGSKSTAQDDERALGWNNQKQVDGDGDSSWGKAKDDNGGRGGW